MFKIEGVEGKREFARYFVSERVGSISYWKGLSPRATYISTSYFLDKITFQKNDLVVDCGANVGDFSLYFELNHLKIRYVGFEPSPREFICLQDNISRTKNHIAYNFGLWKYDGTANFFVSEFNSDSSFIEPVKYSHQVPIQVRRLDNLFNEPIKLLKVEAEGGEPEVIFGCENLLSKIKYITADLGFERGKEQSSTFSEVNKYLTSKRFELIHNISPSGRNVSLFKNKDLFQV